MVILYRPYRYAGGSRFYGGISLLRVWMGVQTQAAVVAGGDEDPYYTIRHPRK